VPHASLDEALLLGQGVERSFLCPFHPDHNASASVNSLTGLWVCYACGAAGKVNADHLVFDSKGIVKFTQQLFEEMTANRFFPESWLNVFDAAGPGEYWLSRFSERIARKYRLGQAPNVATYPMRDNVGRVLGVVTRDLTGERPAKYMYPRGVKVSEHLANYHQVNSDALVLVEGMADVVACAEVGVDTVGSYRAGMSHTQAMLLRKYAPDVLWVAYDQDSAGEAGFRAVQRLLSPWMKVYRLWWSDFKDVAEMPRRDRLDMFLNVLS
jgi:DNA primase